MLTLLACGEWLKLNAACSGDLQLRSVKYKNENRIDSWGVRKRWARIYEADWKDDCCYWCSLLAMKTRNYSLPTGPRLGFSCLSLRPTDGKKEKKLPAHIKLPRRFSGSSDPVLEIRTIIKHTQLGGHGQRKKRKPFKNNNGQHIERLPLRLPLITHWCISASWALSIATENCSHAIWQIAV